MLINSNDLTKFKLHGTDGDLGQVKDILFDTEHWGVRYLVVDTGAWLVDRSVLISPHAITSVSKDLQTVTVNLTKKQIEDSPPLEKDKELSAQFERDYHAYYGWPVYWGGPFMWGFSYSPIALQGFMREGEPKDDVPKERDLKTQLRTTRDVISSSVQGDDGELGHVESFIVDDEAWAIRYLVVDTRKWWSGKKVLIAPKWVDQVSWTNNEVFVQLDKAKIKGAPEYDDKVDITREYESTLYAYYDRKGYWA